MHRRTLLGLVASAGTVGVLGGRVGTDNRPSAPPATYAEERVLPGGKWNCPVVATDTTTAGIERYGTVRQHASVLNPEPASRYALVTGYRLVPGSNYDAGSGWRVMSLTVEHDWRSGSIVSHFGDVVPADDGNTDSNLHLSANQSTGRHRWHLAFDAATGNSTTLRFATVVNRDEPPEEGDDLIDATFGASFTKGLLRASERDIATARLTMRGASE
jgi:hypothetical protein